MALQAYARRYQRDLFESVIPFWMRHSLDREYGGFFTCLDRDGTVYDTRKYVWLQGRQIWTLSKLYNEAERNEEWLEAARAGVEFLRRNVYDAEGRCYFSLTREGRAAGYQRKPYGAVFVMLGLLEYSKASGDAGCRAEAEQLFERVQQWIANPALLGRPVLPGAPPSSSLADIYVLASMALELGHTAAMRQAVDGLSQFVDHASGLLCEAAGPGLREYPEGRLVCVGSIFEIAWVFLRVLEHVPDEGVRQIVLRSVTSALEFGWDKEYGGFAYFQDLDRKPLLQLEGSLRLWWVHAEAICCLVHCYQATGETHWERWLEIVDAYTFSHFSDGQFGEWFGYLGRDGQPTHTLKGNNYKGCFHIPRAEWLSMRVIERLSR